MISAGLLRWQDLTEVNSPGPGFVEDPEGGAPPKRRLSTQKLQIIQNRLMKIGKKQFDESQFNLRWRQQQFALQGFKQAPGQFYPGLKAWTPPQRLPGVLPNQANIMTVTH